MKKIATVLIIISVFVFSGCASEYHVSPSGLDSNGGTKRSPFKTISAAAKAARGGDVVTVHEGVYRERVNPLRGGSSDSKRIVYQAAEGEKVVIKGSEIVKGWKKVQHDTWKVVLPNSFFGNFNPYSDVIGGEWYRTPRDGFDRHTGAVYLNGVWLDEAKELKNVLVPAGDRQYWKAEVDENSTTIRAQFKGVDPNKEMVEINVRQSVFYPDEPGRDYITVRGFIMRHAATPWSGAMSEQIGLIGTHWSKGWVIEDNVISHSMNTGITLGRYDPGKYGFDLPEATAPGFVESCELAIKHGWSKENIGSHVVRNNHISHCEKNGIHGSLGGVFSVIEGNTICDVAQRGWISGPDVAGLKRLGSQDTIIKDNHIYRCGGVGGVWLDWMAQGTRMTGNLLHENIKDLFAEVNHGPLLIDNNIFLSPFGVLESCGGGAYVHNLFAGEIRLRRETSRKTPYHPAHSTEIAGLSKVVGDDERFFNNIFAGYEGLVVYDAWGAKNVAASGNVYVSGAKPHLNEKNAFVDESFEPAVKLHQKDDEFFLEFAVDQKWTSIKQRDTITTGLLGNAKVPDVPFVKPDGTPYKLTRDYFGKKRNTDNPAPGPFEIKDGNVIKLKVWPKD